MTDGGGKPEALASSPRRPGSDCCDEDSAKEATAGFANGTNRDERRTTNGRGERGGTERRHDYLREKWEGARSTELQRCSHMVGSREGITKGLGFASIQACSTLLSGEDNRSHSR